MRRVGVVIVAVVSTLIPFGCSEDGNPVRAFNSEFRYPLQVGNRWEYEYTFRMIDAETDTLLYERVDTALVVITGVDTLLGTIVTHMSEVHITIQDSHITRYHHRHDEDALLVYGIEFVVGGWGSYPLSAHEGGEHSIYPESESWCDTFFPLIAPPVPMPTTSQSLHIYDPPLKRLSYPLSHGARWMYQYDPCSDDANYAVRVVLGEDSVEVEAGTFQCVEIETEWFDGVTHERMTKQQLHDFHSSCGLVRRYQLYEGFTERDSEGNVVGYMDIESIFELLTYRLH